MILKYKRFPSDDPASVPILGQLDTGADQTLINKEIADALYVDWKSGTKSFTNGITGKPVPYYLHDLEIEVDGLPGSRVKTRVGFVDLRNVGVLLGQFGFFEHFKVSFAAKHEEFTIDILRVCFLAPRRLLAASLAIFVR